MCLNARALPAAVAIHPACLGLYCGRTVLAVNGSLETYGDCGVGAGAPSSLPWVLSAAPGGCSASWLGSAVTPVLCFPQVCPRGQRTDENKICRECVGSPDRYDWLYLGFMAMLPLVLHWFFIEWYSGKKRLASPSFKKRYLKKCTNRKCSLRC